MKLFSAAFVAIALAIMSVPANASVTLSGAFTDQGGIPNPQNKWRSQLNGLGFSSIVSGKLKVTTSGTVSFFYHGQESDWKNQFIARNQDNSIAVTYTETLPHNDNTPWNAAGLALGSMSVAANDVLKLFFDSNNGPRHAIGTAEFGIFSNNTIESGSFTSASLVGNNGRIYFGHDDNGAGPDDNHDDIIISAIFEADAIVPEPMSAMVWIGLLGATSVIGYRRRLLHA